MGEHSADGVSLERVEGGRSATGPASASGGFHAGAGALADEVGLEFGDGSEDVEDEFAAGGGGVDGFGEGPELDAGVSEFCHGPDEVGEGAAEPVEAPDHDDVAGAGEAAEGFELGAVIESAGGAVGEDPLAAGGGEGVGLKRRVLEVCGDAGVADEHGCQRTERVGHAVLGRFGSGHGFRTPGPRVGA